MQILKRKSKRFVGSHYYYSSYYYFYYYYVVVIIFFIFFFAWGLSSINVQSAQKSLLKREKNRKNRREMRNYLTFKSFTSLENYWFRLLDSFRNQKKFRVLLAELAIFERRKPELRIIFNHFWLLIFKFYKITPIRYFSWNIYFKYYL